ncbi:MAG: hypothetical protein QOD40_2076 [Alphaproteobacteria bacterium]|jgi:hypothetical protein|nr:hypothetical protein [Alphaproteobacteria bacterium]
MPRLPIFIASLLLTTLAAAHAQGLKPASSEPAKPLLDNERMRVSEIRVAPRAKIGLPNHPDQFAYLLTDASLVFLTPGKTPYQLEFKAGEATLLPAQSTEAANESDREVRALLVEIKSGGSARAAGRSKGKGKASTRVAATKSGGPASRKTKMAAAKGH